MKVELENQIIAKLRKVLKLNSKQLHDLFVRERILGRPKAASQCPIGRYLGPGCRAGSFELRIGKRIVPTPNGFAMFIHDFDTGKYPDLVAPKKPRKAPSVTSAARMRRHQAKYNGSPPQKKIYRY